MVRAERVPHEQGLQPGCRRRQLSVTPEHQQCARQRVNHCVAGQNGNRLQLWDPGSDQTLDRDQVGKRVRQVSAGHQYAERHGCPWPDPARDSNSCSMASTQPTRSGDQQEPCCRRQSHAPDNASVTKSGGTCVHCHQAQHGEPRSKDEGSSRAQRCSRGTDQEKRDARDGRGVEGVEQARERSGCHSGSWPGEPASARASWRPTRVQPASRPWRRSPRWWRRPA